MQWMHRALWVRRVRVWALVVLGCCSAWAWPVMADEHEASPQPGFEPRFGPGPPLSPRPGPPPGHERGREHGHDHHMARQALEQGRVLPLRSVLEKVERDYQGQVLKIEFEQERGQFFYEIRLLQSDGRMAKLKVDAVDGRVLFIKRREP